MSKLYEYSQKLFKEAPKTELLGRKVRVFNGDIEIQCAARPGEILEIIEVKDNYLVINYIERGKNQRGYDHFKKEFVVVPETKEELELHLQDQNDIMNEIQMKFKCLDEMKTDRIDDKSFKIWRLVKQIKEEKDEEKLTKLLIDNIKV